MMKPMIALPKKWANLMKISLEVNWISLEMGMPLDELLLSSYGFKKMGFFTRSILPIPKKRGDVIFSAKNPAINAFSSAAQAGGDKYGPLGPEMVSKTACYMFYNRNKLRYVICQVIESSTVAHQFSSNTRKAALETLGEPIKTDGAQLWKEDNESFAFEIGSGGRNTVIHWWTE